jgi:hypothetical protein
VAGRTWVVMATPWRTHPLEQRPMGTDGGARWVSGKGLPRQKPGQGQEPAAAVSSTSGGSGQANDTEHRGMQGWEQGTDDTGT